MSRALKFRRWDAEKGEMKEVIALALPVESENVMQWTGLVDKNGTDVYEGDIVVWEDVGLGYRYTSLVGWDARNAGFVFAIHGKYDTMPTVPKSYLDLSDFHLPIVVGNVFENPELLAS